jgi:hypothetical protein
MNANRIIVAPRAWSEQGTVAEPSETLATTGRASSAQSQLKLTWRLVAPESVNQNLPVPLVNPVTRYPVSILPWRLLPPFLGPTHNLGHRNCDIPEPRNTLVAGRPRTRGHNDMGWLDANNNIGRRRGAKGQSVPKNQSEQSLELCKHNLFSELRTYQALLRLRV